MSELTHINQGGNAHMVDVSGKAITARIAVIQAAKKCANLIPLCHSLALASIRVKLTPNIAR